MTKSGRPSTCISIRPRRHCDVTGHNKTDQIITEQVTLNNSYFGLQMSRVVDYCVQNGGHVLVVAITAFLVMMWPASAAMATVKNPHQHPLQLRVKPQPSASSSSGLPVPDLLESPDAKYDPKPKDIDAAALRLRLKGEDPPTFSLDPSFFYA